MTPESRTRRKEMIVASENVVSVHESRNQPHNKKIVWGGHSCPPARIGNQVTGQRWLPVNSRGADISRARVPAPHELPTKPPQPWRAFWRACAGARPSTDFPGNAALRINKARHPRHH